MNARLGILLLAGVSVLALALGVAPPVIGQSGIVVNGADAIRETTVSSSTALNMALESAQPRIVGRDANAWRQVALPSLPVPLQSALAQLRARVVYAYASGGRLLPLPALPVPLRSLCGQTAPRTVFAGANSARAQTLLYPATLIADTAPPVLSEVATLRAPGGIRFVWTTDEFADSAVGLGTQPGIYTWTLNDPLYVTGHSLAATGLIEGATYFFKASSRDRSGNLAEGPEQSFVATQDNLRLYLPMVQR